jgi:hypothetical protein
VRRYLWPICLALVLTDCTRGGEGNTTATPTRANLLRMVTYEVYTSDSTDGGPPRSADITMQVPGGGTSQQSGVDLPMMRDGGGPMNFDNVAVGTFVYISAQNNQEYGDISCAIKVDGKIIQTITSSGAYVIATCSGTA